MDVAYVNQYGVTETLTVKGRISFLIADSPGRSEYNRHMGVKATKNCSSCTVGVKERVSVTHEILSAQYVRRVAQTDAIQKQMEEEKKHKREMKEEQNQSVYEESFKSIRTKYGIDFVKVYFFI